MSKLLAILLCIALVAPAAYAGQDDDDHKTWQEWKKDWTKPDNHDDWKHHDKHDDHHDKKKDDCKPEKYYFYAKAEGCNEIPPVYTKTEGVLKFVEYDGKIEGTVCLEDIKDFTMAHLHIGDKKTNGPIAFWVWSTEILKPTVQPLTANHLCFPWKVSKDDFVKSKEAPDYKAFLEFLKCGNVYFNVHTSAHPGGEARGQVYQTKQDWVYQTKH